MDSSRVGLIDVEDGHSIVRHVVHGGDDNVMKQNKDVRRIERKRQTGRHHLLKAEASAQDLVVDNIFSSIQVVYINQKER